MHINGKMLRELLILCIAHCGNFNLISIWKSDVVACEKVSKKNNGEGKGLETEI